MLQLFVLALESRLDEDELFEDLEDEWFIGVADHLIAGAKDLLARRVLGRLLMKFP
jgi:hypothetical protein